MWKGLGKRLKDFAEDLTSPPFEEDEEEEEEEKVEKNEGNGLRERTQPPLPQRGGGEADEHADPRVNPFTDYALSHRSLANELHSATRISPVTRGVVPPRATVQGAASTLQSSPAATAGLAPLMSTSSAQEENHRRSHDSNREANAFTREGNGVRGVALHTDEDKRLQESDERRNEGLAASGSERLAQPERENPPRDSHEVEEKEKEGRGQPASHLCDAHHELTRRIELLNAEAAERQRMFDEERARWESALREAQDAARAAASRDDPTPLPSSEDREKALSLERQVIRLNEEVATLRQSLLMARQALQERGAEHRTSRPASLLSTPSLEPIAVPPPPSQGQQEQQAATHLVKLVAAKDREIERLKEEVERLEASRQEAQEQLHQLSERCTALSSVRSSEHTPQQQAEAEGPSPLVARVAELEQLLTDNEEASRVAASQSAARAASALEAATLQVQELESRVSELTAQQEGLLARCSQAKAADAQKQRQVAELQGALEKAEGALAAAAQAHQEERQRLESTQREQLDAAEAAVRRSKEEAAAAAAAAAIADTGAVTSLSQEQVDAIREENGVLKRSLDTLASDLDAVTKQKDAAVRSVTLAEAEGAALKATLAETETALRALQEQQKTDRTRDASVASLQCRVRGLEEERQRTDEVLTELQRSVVECLTRNSGGSGEEANGGELFDVKSSERYTFPDWILTVTTALDRVAGVARKAGRVQQEWERTYEEARRVNETLQQQLHDTWRSVGQLQEEVSVKDQTLRELTRRVHSSEEAMTKAQRQIASLTNELDALKEEGGALLNREAPSSAPSPGRPPPAEALVLELQAEVESLRLALQERDDELAMTQRSLENLNEVLHSFKASRANDVAERSMELQLEVDQLRAQLEVRTDAGDDLQSALEKQREGFDRELEVKNVEITALQRKLAELRRALENTARQLHEESTVDKRVVSHILVNFIHGFVGQRKETDEVLKVLSSLLNWDEEMQERVGLLPGPLNPQLPQQQKEGRRGLLSWVRGGGGGGGTSRPADPHSSNGSGAVKGGLASLWVDFLMRESELRATEGEGGTSTGAAAHQGSASLAAAALPVPAAAPPSKEEPLEAEVAAGDPAKTSLA